MARCARPSITVSKRIRSGDHSGSPTRKASPPIAVKRRSLAAVRPVGAHDELLLSRRDHERRKPGIVRTKAAEEGRPFRRTGAVVDQRLLGVRIEVECLGLVPGGDREGALAEQRRPAEAVGEGDDPYAVRRVRAHVGDVAEHVAAVAEAVVVDVQPVAVGLVLVLERLEGGLHRGQARARQELSLVPERPQPGGQILGGAAQASVGFGGLDPRGGRQAVIALPGAVVVERHVTSGQPPPRVMDHDRAGRPHPEPVEQAPLKQFAVGPSGHRLQDDSDRAIADVGVVAVLTRRESSLGVGESDDVVGRRGREVGAGDHCRPCG